jgi:hypothetical protein
VFNVETAAWIVFKHTRICKGRGGSVYALRGEGEVGKKRRREREGKDQGY